MIDETLFPGYTAHYHTFGCKLNFAETSTVARLMTEKGIRRASAADVPDFVVVNTCSVTELADKKCRQAIRSLHRRWPQAAIVVTGCYAQLKPDTVAGLPGVAIIAGTDRKNEIAGYVEQWLADRQKRREVADRADLCRFEPSCSRGDRTRYFLKVQDGCDYWCTYCTIPRARGRSRSGTVAQMVEQARNAAAAGGREIVITGVNIGDFGKGTHETLADLVRALDAVEGIERYRISSIEPNLLTDEIIDFCASSRRFMPHFHIPLQSGSDEVLKLMRRHYDTALFRSKIERIRRTLPDAFIGVDLIVGARGETEELFDASRRFVESLDISQLHVFTYSERPGTKALEIPYIVDSREKHRRTSAMLALSEAKHASFAARFCGSVRPVLLEHSRDGAPTGGFTDNYLRIRLSENPGPEMDNKIVDVLLGDYDHATQTVTATLIK